MNGWITLEEWGFSNLLRLESNFYILEDYIMEKIKTLNDLKINTKTLDSYIIDKKDPLYTFGLNLIKKGTCFVVIKDGEQYKFYPSRFIGYLNNNMEDHLNNNFKDGRETNPTISYILGNKPLKKQDLNKKYIEYCESLGFAANEKGSFGVERKFWDVLS